MKKKAILFFYSILLAQLSFAFSNINITTLDKPIAALTSANVNSPIYIAPGTISVTTSSNNYNNSYVSSLNSIYTCNNGSASSASNFYIVENFSSSTSRTITFTITAPSNFEVSTNGSNYYSSVNTSVTINGSSLKTSRLYVRVKSNVTGTPSGTITINSGDGATFNLAVSATVMDIPTGTANDGYIVGSSATISVTVTSYSGSTNTVKWYTSLTSGLSLRTGTSYTITNISSKKHIMQVFQLEQTILHVMLLHVWQ